MGNPIVSQTATIRRLRQTMSDAHWSTCSRRRTFRLSSSTNSTSPKISDLRALTANTIKDLSDYAVNVTVIIVGVADDIGELIEKHESIGRCIEQIPMPRMSNDEMKEVLQKRLPRLGMKIEADALWKIITLARGLPAYVHLLGLHATQDAIRMRRTTVTVSNVDSAIQRALAKSQESVQREYATATHTNRNDTLFREVLLACALATTDERGLFTPNAVVGPLSSILKREITIANFQNHLKKFIGDERSKILIRRGKERAYKFRFRDPIMQPYVIMKGVRGGVDTGGCTRRPFGARTATTPVSQFAVFSLEGIEASKLR